MDEDDIRAWKAYDLISDTLSENDFTNGDILFVMGVMLADLVKDADFDFEEMFQNLRESALVNIKILADA